MIAVVALVAGGDGVVRKRRRSGGASRSRWRCASPSSSFSLLLEKITDYKLTVFGLMILFVVYYLPDGIFGFLRQLVAQCARTGSVRTR